jgi:hypothetical protein
MKNIRALGGHELKRRSGMRYANCEPSPSMPRETRSSRDISAAPQSIQIPDFRTCFMY